MLTNVIKAGLLFLILTCSTGHSANAETVYDKVRDLIRTIKIESSVQRYEPRQSVVAGAIPIHTSDYKALTVWDPANKRAHEAWDMSVIYPVPGKLDFSFTYNEFVGIKEGKDGFLSKADVPMESSRNGASFKELWLSNPMFLLAYGETQKINRKHVDGMRIEQHQLILEDTEWLVNVDEGSGYPLSVSTMENDPHNGRIENRIRFSDWRDINGIPMPFRLEQFTGGELVRREVRLSVAFNPGDAETLLSMDSSNITPGDPDERRWGWDMSHILMKRAGGGGPVDQPQIDNISIEEIDGSGIYLVPGTHNNLIVEGPDGLALVDASWYSERSEALLTKIREKWPGKPIKYLILTHHHIDHTGGIRPVIEAGATVVTSAKNADYFRGVFKSSIKKKVKVIDVDQFMVLSDIGREIHVYDVYTTHVEGMLAPYIPDEKLLFNADLFSPNRPLQFNLWFKELMNAIEFHRIDVAKHVGAHGIGVAAHPVDTSNHNMQVIRKIDIYKK